MFNAGSWFGDDDDAKPPCETKFGLTGVGDQFSGNSAKNMSYAHGVNSVSKTYQYNERVPVSLQPRRNPTSRTHPADGLCSLQNTSTAENSSKNTKPVKIVPGKYLSTNQQPVKATNSNSMGNKISSGAVNRTTPLQLEHKKKEIPTEIKRPILPSKKIPSKEQAIDLVSGDEDSNRNTTSTNTKKKGSFISPERKTTLTKAIAAKPKKTEHFRHDPVRVRDIFKNRNEVFDKRDCELSIRFDGALRAILLVGSPDGKSFIEHIFFKDIRDIVVFSESSKTVPNFFQINIAKVFHPDQNEVLDLCDENVDPLTTRYLVTMSLESLRTATDLMKHHPYLKTAAVHYTTDIDEIVECLDPYLLREAIDSEVLISQLEVEMPRCNSKTSRVIPRRTSRRRSGGIGLLTQQSDPDDHLTYMTYPIEFGAQDVITISRGDLKRFADREYFNDNLIDLKVKYMIFSLSPEQKSRVYAFSCLFYPKLKELRNFRKAHELISRWTKNVDIFNMDFIFIPINYSLHWSLCVVVRPILWLLKEYCGDVNDIALREIMDRAKDLDDGDGDDEGCILFLDSLNMHEMRTIHRDVTNYLSFEWKAKHLKRIAQQSNSAASSSTMTDTAAAQDDPPSTTTAGSLSPAQRKAIDDILADKIDLNGDDNIFSSIPSVKCKVPIQENGFDCGVFVIKFVEKLLQVFPRSTEADIADKMRSQLHGKWFTQQDITQERKTYRQLLAGIEVEWKQSREKLKEEGVLTEDAISQGPLEISSFESQERMKQIQYEASGHDQEGNVELEEEEDIVYSSCQHRITGRDAVLDEHDTFVDKNPEIANAVEYDGGSVYEDVCENANESIKRESRHPRGQQAAMDDADPSSIAAVENTDWIIDETLVDSYLLHHTVGVEKSEVDLFSENISPCPEYYDESVESDKDVAAATTKRRRRDY